MSDRGILAVPFDTHQSQALAADPDHSIWVEANAGSGKTFVLTNRVLRLLLAGVKPQSILCLTYTKAAAAEMRKRVGERLAQWALHDDDALLDDIAALIGRSPTGEERQEARSLFARALESPGGLRILTIHAFCEAVLHRFPIEAGVPFDFAVIEEDRQATLLLSAREKVLAEGLRGGANAAAVESLFGLLSDDAITKAIHSALGEGARLKPLLADIDAAKANLRHEIGYRGGRVEDLQHRILADTLLSPDLTRRLVACLKGYPGGNSRCADLLARLDPDRFTLHGLRAVFFTGKGEPRARLMLKKEIETFPDLHDLLRAEQERLVALEAELAAALLVQRSEAILNIVAAIAARYEADKRRHALLDFDDLIEKLGDLFSDAALGPWVQYKLDAGIDHILVDESQDTNARQWRVVKALADEFFTGAGAVSRPRSIFAVGDQKQSIYSFQGAQPVLFGETGRDMGRRAIAAERRFAHVRLHTSFRTLKNILDAVDLVCDRPDIQAALLSSDKIIHQPARRQAGGMVTLWPPLQDEKLERQGEHWPVEPPGAELSADRQVAQRIAREIRAWIDQGRILGERNRPVAADDVLILVQKRGPLFQEIIRALRAENLPSPGADRLAVNGHIAVLDLLALIDVLLNPAEDLQLAALLRSPLFDVGEAALYDIAHNRAEGQTLYSALFASSHPAARAAAEKLGRWRAGLDMERPFEFLAGLLYEEGGLKRFHARLGGEVDDVLSELLALALDHEQRPQPSLQGFAAEMRRRAATIKRELAESGGGVRVMTVHGAKGLEAPIVILADAASKPSSQQQGKPVYVLDQAPGPLLVHAASLGQHVEASAGIKARLDGILAEEYWRRLYVAMTRAEDELYVTGTLGAGKAETKLDGTWYQAVEAGLGEAAMPLVDAAGAVSAKVFPAPVQAHFRVPTGAGAPAFSELSLKGVSPPPAEPVIQPSGVGPQRARPGALDTKAEALRDAEAARRGGLALHALLQHLGRVEPKDRERVAPRALEVLLTDFPHLHAPLAAKSLAILARPELAPLFGPASRAELPFRVRANQRGKAVILSGRIDRVVVDDSGVLVVDYKSDAAAPQGAAEVPGNYLTQLGLYALVAGQLFPGRPIRAAILWTELESLMNLPDELLREARADFTLR